MNAVVDRVVQYPHRYQLKNVNTGEVLGTFDLEPITGTISVVGTKIDKALFDSIASDLSARLVSNGGDAKDNIVTYSMASNRSNIASGEKLSVSFGKIAKYFSDLKAVAFSGSKADIGLGNVDNTSDANKPVSNATQQALNLKANSSDVYSKTETDGLLNDKANTNDVYSKTKTDELLNNKANKSDVYTKTETDGLLNDKANANNVYTKSETDAGLNKSLYNLGYYDTITANSDGTYTITRQTGYLDSNDLLKASNINCNPSNDYICQFSGLLNVSSGDFTFIICNSLPRSWSSSVLNRFYVYNNSIYMKIDDLTTTDAYKQYVAQNNLFFQYKLATATTERVEKNHYARYNQRFILEHNKSEAERSANLFDDNGTNSVQYIGHYFISSSYNLSSQNDYNCFRIRVEQNKTYYIKQINELILRYEDINNNVLGGNANFYQSGYGAFTTPNGCKYVVFSKAINLATNVTMLNEGSVALPYQPYEGKVVHEKELESITPGIFSLVGNNVDTLTISKNETYFITSVAVNPIYVEGNTGISFIGSSLVTTVGMLSGEPKICINGSAYSLDNNTVTLKTTGLMKVYKVG